MPGIFCYLLACLLGKLLGMQVWSQTHPINTYSATYEEFSHLSFKE